MTARRLPPWLGGLAVVALLLAGSPLAGAFGVGVDAKGIAEVKTAGATPAYGQTWIGNWVKTSGWSGVESQIRATRDAGATPVLLFYYWGDDITVDGVKYGQNGRTKSDWDAMAKEAATRARNVMGSKPFYFVLEPEFNKNGVQRWETFDGHLENQARIVKSAAPNAKVVVGFGHWGGWDIFDRAAAASDAVGFQWMSASTRNSESHATGAADKALEITRTLKAKFGKPVVLFDLAIGSYGGWESVQEKSIQNFAGKRGDLERAGLQMVVWRYVRDNDYSSGYFGPAESSWGAKYRDGRHKPMWNDLVAFVQGGSSDADDGSSGSSPATGTTGSVAFEGVKVYDWWVQASVEGATPGKVEARIDGGSWLALTQQSWGGYAKSTRVHPGQHVEFRATLADGATYVSARFAHGTTGGASGGTLAAPTSSTSSGSAGGGFAAAFEDVKVHDWWVQADVESSKAVARVEARVDGGAWVALDDKGWGWARSLRVLPGQGVEFRATATDGTTALSARFAHGTTGGSSGATSSAASAGGALAATFEDVKVLEWWVQTDVESAKAIARVEARIGGGTWVALDDKGWGWARSLRVLPGQGVEFRATATDGTTAVSRAYTR